MVRNTAVEPSGRSTDGGLPEVMLMTSMRCKATSALSSRGTPPADAQLIAATRRRTRCRLTRVAGSEPPPTKG
jgi:hypothetical protein